MPEEFESGIPHAICDECGLEWWSAERYEAHIAEDHGGVAR